jgi:hypothetical protein
VSDLRLARQSPWRPMVYSLQPDASPAGGNYVAKNDVSRQNSLRQNSQRQNQSLPLCNHQVHFPRKGTWPTQTLGRLGQLANSRAPDSRGPGCESVNFSTWRRRQPRQCRRTRRCWPVLVAASCRRRPVAHAPGSLPDGDQDFLCFPFVLFVPFEVQLPPRIRH